MADPEKTEQIETDAEALKKVAEDLETAKAEEVKAEEKLEAVTEKRLETVLVKEESLDEVPPEPSEKSDDSTPEKKPAEEPDDKDGPTAAEKKEEAKLKAEAKIEAEASKKEDDKEADDEVKDEDVDKGKDKKKEIPQLSDAYVRAAIHEGWTEEDIKTQYEANPELTVKTLGNIYESVNRLSKQYSAIGRAEKERIIAEKSAPEKKQESEQKPEFKGVDIEVLKKADADPDVIAVVEALNQQGKLQFDELQELKSSRSAPVTGQPSGLSPVQVRAVEQEAAAVEQQIETFFRDDELKGYDDFYGGLPKDAINWDKLTPGQKMNRWAVIEMMDQMIAGARTLGREMKIDEAMNLAHLSVTEPIREKVIRKNIEAKVTKRSSNLTLKPSGTAQPGETKPQTKQELEDVTAERLNKMNW